MKPITALPNLSRRRFIGGTLATGTTIGVNNSLAEDRQEGAFHLGPGSAWVTGGSDRLASRTVAPWRPAKSSETPAIELNPGAYFRDVLGFGAAFTDATCYMLNQLPAGSRADLLNELFGPSNIGLNACRLCIGASDYSTRPYSYDEGEPDPELVRFSIEHDRAYILPTLQSARACNPELFLLGSPWSPPGWMKMNGSLFGGSMRKKWFAAYANYLKKFLLEYRNAGVPIDAITVQNEPDTDQDGSMPACLWGQEYEMEFISRHLGPLLAESGLKTQIWILDHNYSLWGRAICELEDSNVNRYVDGVAWHGYVGQPTAMTRVHEAYPNKHMYWTEGGPGIHDPRNQIDWANWGSWVAEILHNWSRCVIGWNLALDEAGRPNIGAFDCAGMVTIHSKTKEISQSGQFWALAHYCRAAHRGAKRIGSSGEIPGIAHCAFMNPDRRLGMVLANTGNSRRILLRALGQETEIDLPDNAIATLTWPC